MMYKLLNKLFGWDYVQAYYSVNCPVARVQVDGMRRVWYLQVYEFDGERRMLPSEIKEPEDFIWLTCSPDKYFPPSVPKKGAKQW